MRIAVSVADSAAVCISIGDYQQLDPVDSAVFKAQSWQQRDGIRYQRFVRRGITLKPYA
jgi:hypothetical protein